MNKISLVFDHVCFRIFRSKFGISGLIEPTTHIVICSSRNLRDKLNR